MLSFIIDREVLLVLYVLTYLHEQSTHCLKKNYFGHLKGRFTFFGSLGYLKNKKKYICLEVPHPAFVLLYVYLLIM